MAEQSEEQRHGVRLSDADYKRLKDGIKEDIYADATQTFFRRVGAMVWTAARYIVAWEVLKLLGGKLAASDAVKAFLQIG